MKKYASFGLLFSCLMLSACAGEPQLMTPPDAAPREPVAATPVPAPPAVPASIVVQGIEIQEIQDHFDPFGLVRIYKSSENPKTVMLFISGDGGWDDTAGRLVTSLMVPDMMLVGIDVTSYKKSIDEGSEKCVYGAAQFEALSQYIQKKYKFQTYIPPVILGFSSGATMVYAILVQSPPNTFAGGISMGFCPDLDTKHPYCKGVGGLDYRHDPKMGYVYKLAKSVASPWIVLQGEQDEICSTPDTRRFVPKVAGGQIFELPKVGHGFNVQRNWVPEYREALKEIERQNKAAAAPPPADAAVGDLPLIELPAAQKGGTVAVIVTGDGGWANIDKEIGDTLKQDGIPVVGLNSLQYFWEAKTPEKMSADLGRILSHYGAAWKADTFILIGYSRGADVLPFMVSRLPDALKAKIRNIALLGLGTETNFEFKVTDWISDGPGVYKTMPELAKLSGLKVMCFYGTEEDDPACKKLDPAKITIVEKKGGHHFGGDYEGLARQILGSAAP